MYKLGQAVFLSDRPLLQAVAFSEVPEHLQGKFNRNRKIYRLASSVSAEYRGRHYWVNEGFYTDLMSLPMRGPISSRLSRYWALEIGAIFHDAAYRGLIKVPNRKFADCMIYDFAMSWVETPPRLDAEIVYYTLRAVSRLFWKPEYFENEHKQLAGSEPLIAGA